ncbi:MAG: hypothetical protein ACI4PW_09175 [Alphaproteobacteria bacterium]|jgi:cell division protein FtsL
MARFSLILLFAFMATGMFIIKNRVIDLESDLERINAQIREDQKALHVLKAEWTYLNDPARIRTLSSRHANMKPLRGEQIISFSAIPFKNQDKAEAGLIRVSYAPLLNRE